MPVIEIETVLTFWISTSAEPLGEGPTDTT